VKVRADTPRTTYDGKTYYFCSAQCRKEFEAGPDRYLRR
jgi:YHS domain-containing protein